jgi:hypothetical protein
MVQDFCGERNSIAENSLQKTAKTASRGMERCYAQRESAMRNYDGQRIAISHCAPLAHAVSNARGWRADAGGVFQHLREIPLQTRCRCSGERSVDNS